MFAKPYSLIIFFISSLILFIAVESSTPKAKTITDALKLIESLSRIAKLKSLDHQQKKENVSEVDKLINKASEIKKEREMKINSNLIVNGSIMANKIVTDALTIHGLGKLDNNLLTTTLDTSSITSQTVHANSITSPTGVIEIEGDVIISNDDDITTTTTNGDSFAISGVKQFSLLHHDDFDDDVIEGWSDKRRSSCNDNGNAFLGGHCKFSYNEVSKTFRINAPHTQIRITAGFHMFDNWNGEYGYMKVNGDIMWMREGKVDNENGMNICGGNHNDPAFNLEIDVIVPHTSNNVTITFGSTLQKDPCEASFGVDDVMIYTK